MTSALLAKKKAMERNLCKAVGPIQDLAHELFADGVLESITNVFIGISNKFPPPEDFMNAIVYNVSRHAEQRQKVKRNDTPTTIKKVDVPPNRVDKNLPVDFIQAFSKCESMKKGNILDFSEDNAKYFKSDLEENINEKELPKEIISAIYNNYSGTLADDIAKFLTVEPSTKKTKSCTNILKSMVGEQEPNEDMLLKWGQENLCVSSTDDTKSRTEDSAEQKDDSGIRSLATRLVTPNFPKFSSRRKYFSNAKDTQAETVKPVRKYRLEGQAERIRSNTSVFYPEEKRLNLEPTPKSLAANEPRRSLLDDKLFEELDPEHKERNEEIKKYMERIDFARMERIDRFGDSGLIRTYKNKSLDDFIKVKIPDQNFEIFKQRMLVREKQLNELNKKKSYIKNASAMPS